MLALLLRAAALAEVSIPYTTLKSGGKLPLLVMGDGVGWGRGTNCKPSLSVPRTRSPSRRRVLFFCRGG